jgi:hypothetical protein
MPLAQKRARFARRSRGTSRLSPPKVRRSIAPFSLETMTMRGERGAPSSQKPNMKARPESAASGSATRAALQHEQLLRKSAEKAEMRSKEELAAELAAMERLQVLGIRLLAETELQPLLEELLDASIALLNADLGNIQLYDEETGALRIVAQRGFTGEFLDYFHSVQVGTGSCGEALQRKTRFIVEDVLTDPVFQPHLRIAAVAGFRAVQSTPLLGRRGQMLE